MTDYLIWSNEHRRWWGPNHSGYERRVENAGRYSHEQALRICAEAIPGTSIEIGMLPELPVRAEDVRAMLIAFAALYPDHDPEPER